MPAYLAYLLTYLYTHSPACSLTQVRATLHNVGARAAAETAQLYLGLPAAAGAPPRQLKGFVKRFLQPGERNRLSFALSAAELAAWNATSRRVEPVAGEFAVFVGTSSRVLPLGATTPVQLAQFASPPWWPQWHTSCENGAEPSTTSTPLAS